jgi:predicted metal-dependent HD superfamily phosphohydrolase
VNPAAGELRDELLARWNATLSHQEQMAADLLSRYAEPHRRYHTGQHLARVLRAVDELADDHDLFLVRLAAWFHDAVYAGNPGADERDSARLAASTLPALGVGDERVAEVVRLVELTATHDPAPDDKNGAVLCDADLAVLGGDPETYAAYAAAVRAEYAHVDEELFRRGRAEVLERLLSGKPLYRTAAARERWEDAARRNVRTELTLLRGGASAS